MNQEFSLDRIDIISPEHYEKNGYPHAEWAYLRKNKPVFWYERPKFDPFWAITKHADIITISRQPDLFLNDPRLLVFPVEGEGQAEETPPFRHLLDMDPPEHFNYRSIISRRFTPRAVRKLEPLIDAIAKRVIDDVTSHVLEPVEKKGECDFVIDISSKVPLAVIAELLGVPREDWEKLFQWTNETIGGSDPEFQRGTSTQETLDRARLALFQYFSEIVAKRQKEPKDDLTSIIATATIDGKPLQP
ncbi:MAG TPA: hypothetical protein VIX12_00325, partial [Candidatus Binataceae bacterium]